MQIFRYSAFPRTVLNSEYGGFWEIRPVLSLYSLLREVLWSGTLWLIHRNVA